MGVGAIWARLNTPNHNHNHQLKLCQKVSIEQKTLPAFQIFDFAGLSSSLHHSRNESGQGRGPGGWRCTMSYSRVAPNIHHRVCCDLLFSLMPVWQAGGVNNMSPGFCCALCWAFTCLLEKTKLAKLVQVLKAQFL